MMSVREGYPQGLGVRLSFFHKPTCEVLEDPCFMDLALCTGMQSCWKELPWPNCSKVGRVKLSKMSWYAKA